MKLFNSEHFWVIYLQPHQLPLSDTICWGENTKSSSKSDVCPAIRLEKMFLFAPLYIFGGAGVVLAVQEGKGCGGSHWGRVKRDFSTQTQAALKRRSNLTLWNSERVGGGTKATSSCLFVIPNLWSCMLCSRACLALTKALLWHGALWLLLQCVHTVEEKQRLFVDLS